MSEKILVLGGNGGLGLALVKHLVARGASVYATYRRDPKELDAVMAEGYGTALDVVDRVLPLRGTEPEDFERVLSSVMRDGKPLAAVITLIGTASSGMAWKAGNRAQWAFESNLLPVILAAEAVVPIFRTQRSGRFVTVSSVVAHRPVAGTALYASMKAGVEAFTRTLAHEVFSKDVFAGCLSLGYFGAGMIRDVPEAQAATLAERIPAGRLGTVDEFCEAVDLMLLAPQYLSGQVVRLDGGLT